MIQILLKKVVSISEKKYKLKEVENYSKKRNCIKYGGLTILPILIGINY
uniref:Ribosomal RNA methyltransferase n=1 Tax=Klebsiella pneumoniae TaxID=573 RepID=A0A8B0SVY8_KLEPN|nr:ribosomal RNA methyltransferase [Klebsiella pneumoniae]